MTTTTALPGPATTRSSAAGAHGRTATGPGSRPLRTAATVRTRRAARDAGLALVAALALALPAGPLVVAAAPTSSALDVAVSFLVVAGLELVAARGVYAVARRRAHPAAYAALLSRAGHAVLVVVAATLLAARGRDGLGAFRDDLSTALVVLALHLVLAGLALHRARLAPWALSGPVALGGGAALALTAVSGSAALVPAAGAAFAAEAVLAVALLRCGLRSPRLARG